MLTASTRRFTSEGRSGTVRRGGRTASQKLSRLNATNAAATSTSQPAIVTPRRRAATTRSDEGNEVVFADPLQDQERGQALASVDDEVRPARPDRVGLAGTEPLLLLGVAQEQADAPFQHVERVLHAAVVVPGNLLALIEGQLGDPKARPRRVLRAPLDLVELAAVLDRLHIASRLVQPGAQAVQGLARVRVAGRRLHAALELAQRLPPSALPYVDPTQVHVGELPRLVAARVLGLLQP